jgi:hypothetical protein
MILYNPTVSGSLLVTGSLTTTGTITSQTLVVQTITSSIEFVTGSTRNGTLSTNTHEFTGSVLMSGSLVIGATSSDTSYNAGSWFNNSGLAVGNITSTSGIQINSSPTSTLSSIRFGDGDGVNNLYDQGFINYNHNLDRLAFGANRGTAMTITSTGLVELPYGQLKFPSSQNASSDANTLDDYEEGTWTPVVTPTSGSLTSYVSNGYYVKVGRTVTITFGFSIVTTGTASGRADVGGLPFTTLTPSGFGSGNRAATMLVREDGATGHFYAGYAGGGGTALQITTLTGISGINWGNGYAYVSSFVYETNS